MRFAGCALLFALSLAAAASRAPAQFRLLHEAKGPKGHAKAMRGMAPVPGDSAFASATEDGTAALWDGQPGERIREFRGGGGGE